ncbi:MAG: phosphate signaling complex protein PhoU [candidate division Zixibacteria bacterium]|nr:phosphate signaling complex protein PhoU [candidate division Zixibacteria bacterium]
MSVHLHREITSLKKSILSLSAMVEEKVWKSVRALTDRDENLAKSVIEADIEIDKMEVRIEEDCLKILALHQPVAIDLRFIVAVLKINNDLERIGDLAVNIAIRCVALANMSRVDPPPDFQIMAKKTKEMLKKSLDALVNMDTELAMKVREADDEVDEINRLMYEHIKGLISKDLSLLDAAIHLLIVSRNLERIADLATNIAEDVTYMTEGKIVRHQI